MAAGRIKGITVEIGGDTTGLNKALQDVNKEIKNTQSQLRDVEKLLKMDPGNTELLSQKQKLLNDAIGETKEKLATLKTAAEQANQALANGDISREQYDALQREIIETEEALKKLETQANQSATALQKIAAGYTASICRFICYQCRQGSRSALCRCNRGRRSRSQGGHGLGDGIYRCQENR